MDAERYVLLGLAPARAPWFEALARWTMAATINAEFVKCVSAEELRARLASGRLHSAVLVDATTPSFDRDLVDAASAAATPVIAVRPARRPDFGLADVGVAAQLDADFSPDDLLDVLARHCRPVGRGDRMPAPLGEPPGPLWLSQLFTVCGPGGTGASTVAIALAQGLAADPRYGSRVLLADLARRADQAMLHDSHDVGPGLQELVEAHRLQRPPPEDVARTTFEVPARGYRLLLGLRQPEAWSALRPRAVDAALVGLRRSFQAVVADVTGDFEGEADGGSVEVEERNHLARSAALNATVTVVVGGPGLKGTHSLAALVRQLCRAGADPARIVAVVNRSPRHPGARGETSRALGALLDGAGIALAFAGPVHLPERRLDDCLRHGTPLPGPVVDPLRRAVLLAADRVADSAPPETEPIRVTPGSLGTWADVE